MATSTKFKNLKKGAWYSIRFLDHSICNEGVLVTCKVHGWLAKNEKNHISISTWEAESKDFRDHNIELVNIIKSAIISIKELKN